MEGAVSKLSIPQRPRRLAWLALVLAASGMLLLTSDAQAASKRGAVLVKDIRPGHSGPVNCGPQRRRRCHGPQLAFNLRGVLYLAADDGRHGRELWVSDGNRKRTRMVRDINPGPGGSLSPPNSVVVVGLTFLLLPRRQHPRHQAVAQ